MKDFLRGFTYVLMGCREFYGDKRAWKYAAIPLSVIFIFYLLAFWGIFHVSGECADTINTWLSGLPSWLLWLHSLINGLSYFFGVIISLVLLGTTVCIFYEIFGGLFFDSLVEYYERKNFAIVPRGFSIKSNVKYCFDSLFFGLHISIFSLLVFIIGFLFPVVGQFLFITIMGYYTGISYMICSSCNSGLSIAKLRTVAKKKTEVILGFGITAYVLLLIPFATIVVFPGLVLGGANLFNRELKDCL